MNSLYDKKNLLDIDKKRVSCLLLINTQLMKRFIAIYHKFFCNIQFFKTISSHNKQKIFELFQNCARRIHCNLMVLAYIQENYHHQQIFNKKKSKFSYPIIMTTLPDFPELNELYLKLQSLYAQEYELLISNSQK